MEENISPVENKVHAVPNGTESEYTRLQLEMMKVRVQCIVDAKKMLNNAVHVNELTDKDYIEYMIRLAQMAY